MNKLFLGIAIGFAIAAALAVSILKFAKADKYEFGHNNGMLCGESEVIRFLHQHFQVDRPPKEYADALVLKPGGVYVLEDDGKKSIEVIIH